MLTLGVDTFIDLEDANNYIDMYYTEDSQQYKCWQGLSDKNKEAWLRRSTSALNRFKYQGVKAKNSQLLEFPRKMSSGIGGPGWAWYIHPDYDNQYISVNDMNLSDGGMRVIGIATIENAVHGAMLNETVTELNDVNIRGVVSKKVGPISETYNRDNSTTKSALDDIFTQKVYSILNRWLISSRTSI